MGFIDKYFALQALHFVMVVEIIADRMTDIALPTLR